MQVKNADQTACEQLTPRPKVLADQSSLIVQESTSQLADVMIRSFVWRECGLVPQEGVSNGKQESPVTMADRRSRHGYRVPKL